MSKQAINFEEIYLTAIGEAAEPLRWVQEVIGSDDVYLQAWQEIDDARAQLCQRFGMDWEDPALERLVNAILVLEREVGRRLFLCAGNLPG